MCVRNLYCLNALVNILLYQLVITGNWVGLPRENEYALATVGRVSDTNELLRQRALRLVARGVSQKVLAARMGMQPSTFSRWLNQKHGITVRVAALDGLNAYLRELTEAIQGEPNATADAIRRPSDPKRARPATTPPTSARGGATGTDKEGGKEIVNSPAVPHDEQPGPVPRERKNTVPTIFRTPRSTRSCVSKLRQIPFRTSYLTAQSSRLTT